MKKKEVIERFIKYVKIDTQSDPESGLTPSTAKQFDLAHVLIEDLKELGLEVTFDEKSCIVYGRLKGNTPSNVTVGYIAHMDTASDISGADVKPQVIDVYDGTVLKLNDKYNLDPEQFSSLHNYIGKTLITTSGDTLLGSDDKAGITIIMEMLKELTTKGDIKHGDIAIAFTPDEEIGLGTVNFDVKQFNADFAYTIDGGKQGELQYENFNAASVKIQINGRNVHPGTAKGQMINAAELAMKFHGNIAAQMRPEYTDGYEGFYHLIGISGSVENTELQYIIRDHDEQLYNEKIAHLEKLYELLIKPAAINSSFKVSEQYRNMAQMIEPKMYIIDVAKKAMQNCHVEPLIDPIRGGTDGALLSYKGLLCPNIFTGGHNFHGRYEYVCVDSMIKATETIIEISKLVALMDKK